MSTSALLLLSSALRGATIGLVVYGIFVLAARYADQAVTEWAHNTSTDINGVEVLGGTIILTLQIAVPASLLAAFVLAWVLRLRAPWAVALIGVLLLCPLTMLAAHIVHGEMPGWGWVMLVVLAFASAALVPPNGRRRPTPVPSEPGPDQ
jgi:hypothetical protein